MARAHDLRREIETLERQIYAKKGELVSLERVCNGGRHDFGDPKYTPEEIPARHFEGDPPGTMGVDRQLPFDSPARTIEKWTRLCNLCGKTEVTTRTESEIRKKPVF